MWCPCLPALGVNSSIFIATYTGSWSSWNDVDHITCNGGKKKILDMWVVTSKQLGSLSKESSLSCLSTYCLCVTLKFPHLHCSCWLDNGTISCWHHLTTTAKISEFFLFSCQLGYHYLLPSGTKKNWIWKGWVDIKLKILMRGGGGGRRRRVTYSHNFR